MYVKLYEGTFVRVQRILKLKSTRERERENNSQSVSYRVGSCIVWYGMVWRNKTKQNKIVASRDDRRRRRRTFWNSFFLIFILEKGYSCTCTTERRVL